MSPGSFFLRPLSRNRDRSRRASAALPGVVDLNMVRAGVAKHPGEWAHSGYREIQERPRRYGIIDLRGLSTLCGFAELSQFQEAYRHWVDEALKRENAGREEMWSEAIAVGSLGFVDNVKTELGLKAMHRDIAQAGGTLMLRESGEAYTSDFAGENESLRSKNTAFWDKTVADQSLVRPRNDS